MGDDQCQWDEEQQHRRDPEHDVGWSGFDRRAEEIWNDDQQNLGQHEIHKAKLTPEAGAMGLDLGFGRLERIVCGDQPASLKDQSLSRAIRDKHGAARLTSLFL